MSWRRRVLIILRGEAKPRPVAPELLAAQRRLERLEGAAYERRRLELQLEARRRAR